MKKSVLWICSTLLLCCIASRNQITNLPGLENMPSFQQFAGYININDTDAQKGYYYWFVESQTNPENAPILLWLQGGPGCSGLLGFWSENGPFQIQTDGSIKENIYSWNKLANVIYVEQPAGVGFSNASNSQGYSTNDNQTAVDNYKFLQGWFNEFPEYSTNELWLTGESYAGVYIPQLANEILEGSDSNIRNQFQGFMLGNPVIHCPLWVRDSQTVIVNNWYYHGLVSYANRVLWYQNECDIEVTSDCDSLYRSMKHSIGPHSGDNLYKNFCTGNGTLDFTDSVDNCYSITYLIERYLNRIDVQEAIFANLPAGNNHWDYCKSPLVNYTQLGQNMLDYYEKFFEQTNWKILVYNGDIDISTVPHPYTQLCLSALQRPTVKPWARWTVEGPKLPGPDGRFQDNVTAGYQEIYDTYSYATVRGAGHEVPQYQPLFAYTMMDRFIIQKSNL